MNKSFNYSLLLIILLIPVIIYLYFLQWKSGTIYGDDLYIFKGHEGLHSFSEKISMPVSSGKFRPVNGLSIHFLIELLQENKIMGAVLDVTYKEPLPTENPLWVMSNVLLTQHSSGGWAEEASDKVKFFLSNLERFESGEELVNNVDLVKGY